MHRGCTFLRLSSVRWYGGKCGLRRSVSNWPMHRRHVTGRQMQHQRMAVWRRHSMHSKCPTGVVLSGQKYLGGQQYDTLGIEAKIDSLGYPFAIKIRTKERRTTHESGTKTIGRGKKRAGRKQQQQKICEWKTTTAMRYKFDYKFAYTFGRC